MVVMSSVMSESQEHTGSFWARSQAGLMSQFMCFIVKMRLFFSLSSVRDKLHALQRQNEKVEEKSMAPHKFHDPAQKK